MLLVGLVIATSATAQIELLAPPAGPAAPLPEPSPIDVDPANDANVAERLRSIFLAVEGLERIESTVRSGVVTLRGTAPDAAAAAEATALAARVEGVVTVVDRTERTASASESLAPGVERLSRRLRDATRALPMLGVGLAIFFALAGIGTLLASWRAPFQRMMPNAFVAELAAQAVRIGFVAIGLVLALDFMGATALLGAILGAAGILGLAIGFAARDTIENLVASVLMSVRQPFAPNDLVAIEGQEGFVVRLTSRATVLMTREGNHVRIPNATVFKSTIVNYTKNPERRFDFALGVNADANLKAAIELGVRTMEALPFALAEPRPGIWIETVGDSSVILRFVGWIDQSDVDFFQARSEAIRLVKGALEDAGFELPEPIYRLRMEAGPASAPTSERTPDRPAPVEPTHPSDVARLGSVEEKVEAERRGQAGDLLDPAAPRE